MFCKIVVHFVFSFEHDKKAAQVYRVIRFKVTQHSGSTFSPSLYPCWPVEKCNES